MPAPRLQLRMAQQIKLAPVVRQAIALLQLSRLELKTHIAEALDANPLLERDEPGGLESPFEPASESADTRADPPHVETDDRFDDWSDLPEGFSPAGGPEYGASAEDWAADQSDASLASHLLWQLNLSHFSSSDEAIARAIIFALDADGYLPDDPVTIAASVAPEHQVGVEEVEAVRHRLQHFEPTGVASRDLGDCLAVQLAVLPDAPAGHSLATMIVKHHLDLLARKDFDAIAHLTGRDRRAVETASALIRTLDPRPGARFFADDVQYIVPDVYLHPTPDGGLRVSLNPDIDPNLKLNDYYVSLAGQARGEDAKYLKARLAEARWLINGLAMRNQTLLSVTRAIFQRQGDFLTAGEAGIKPLVQREIAEQTDVHESTVSRAVTGKYVHTPRGTFELKYFFSSAVPGAGGRQFSATAVKARIRALVEAEPGACPLSDQALADALRSEGILAARRTVAKYREQLGIPGSVQRKNPR